MQKHGLKGYVVPHDDQHSVKKKIFIELISHTLFLFLESLYFNKNRANILQNQMKDCTIFQDSMDLLVLHTSVISLLISIQILDIGLQ